MSVLHSYIFIVFGVLHKYIFFVLGISAEKVIVEEMATTRRRRRNYNSKYSENLWPWLISKHWIQARTVTCTFNLNSDEDWSKINLKYVSCLVCWLASMCSSLTVMIDLPKSWYNRKICWQSWAIYAPGVFFVADLLMFILPQNSMCAGNNHSTAVRQC